jgi:hypothetical protein
VEFVRLIPEAPKPKGPVPTLIEILDVGLVEKSIPATLMPAPMEAALDDELVLLYTIILAPVGTFPPTQLAPKSRFVVLFALKIWV